PIWCWSRGSISRAGARRHGVDRSRPSVNFSESEGSKIPRSCLPTRRHASMSSSFDHRPESFFVLRTPALPFDELLAWGEADREAARVLLCRWLADPLVRGALYVSSPSLVESLASWRAAPDSKQGRKSERALIRYFQRMAGRPTPFGMLSSCSLGRVDERDCLQIRAFSRARVVARVDLDVLAALVE